MAQSLIPKKPVPDLRSGFRITFRKSLGPHSRRRQDSLVLIRILNALPVTFDGGKGIETILATFRNDVRDIETI